MTSVNFQQWIQHPETLDRDTLYELRNMLARYPYFQSLRLLYLKNLYILHDINFGAELRKAVLYIADRRKLFQLIEGDRFAVQSRKKGVPLTEVLKNEPSVDRTLALFCLRCRRRWPVRQLSTIQWTIQLICWKTIRLLPNRKKSLRS